jgi:hypothetical protein
MGQKLPLRSASTEMHAKCVKRWRADNLRNGGWPLARPHVDKIKVCAAIAAESLRIGHSDHPAGLVTKSKAALDTRIIR